jgi:tetratricopeptide (TPR) repeat protein
MGPNSSRVVVIAAIFLVSLALVLSVPAQTNSKPATSSQAGSAAPVQAKPSDADELVKQGETLARDGKANEALALYQRALQLDPDNYQAQLFTGVALDLKGSYQEARQHLAKAIQLASEQQTVQSLRVMAVSYAFERNTDKASEYERRAFDQQYNWKQYADAAGTADELARIYLESGDYDNAFQWYQTGHLTGLKIPNLTPAQKDLWEFRWEAAQARIAARRGKFDQAKQHLAACKALIDKADNPDQAVFYPYLAGYVAFYSGDYSAAIKQLGMANQKDAFVLCLLAQTYEKLGDMAHAKDYYQQVMAINAHNPSSAFARPLARQKLAERATAPASSGQ